MVPVPKIDVISIGGSAIIPGFIDSHTSSGRDRSFEVSMKRNGLSYQEIAENGGYWVYR